jgi:hypothetical protein
VIVYLLIALGLAAAIYYFVRKMPNPGLQRLLRIVYFGLSVVFVAIGIGLLATGRWTAALVPLAVGAAGLLSWASAARSRAAPTPGATSAVETRMLRLRLDHASGRIEGEVIAGRFAGRRIEDLRQGEAVALLAEAARDDPPSARLVEAYLDRAYPRWRAEAAPGAADAMSREEAYAILGLAPGASAEAVKAAHRRLMQEHHPDRGGSAEMAAKINRARDMLLGD